MHSRNSRHQLPITKHGNVRPHTVLIELPCQLLLWQRDATRVQRWWPVLGNPKASKAAKKKAIVAKARQMAWTCGAGAPGGPSSFTSCDRTRH